MRSSPRSALLGRFFDDVGAPENCERIPELLTRFENRFDELVQKLEVKYDTKFPDGAGKRAAFETKLRVYFNAVDRPELVGKVAALAARFEGRWPKLVRSLEARYHLPFHKAVVGAEDDDDDDVWGANEAVNDSIAVLPLTPHQPRSSGVGAESSSQSPPRTRALSSSPPPLDDQSVVEQLLVLKRRYDDDELSPGGLRRARHQLLSGELGRTERSAKDDASSQLVLQRVQARMRAEEERESAAAALQRTATARDAALRERDAALLRARAEGDAALRKHAAAAAEDVAALRSRLAEHEGEITTLRAEAFALRAENARVADAADVAAARSAFALDSLRASLTNAHAAQRGVDARAICDAVAELTVGVLLLQPNSVDAEVEAAMAEEALDVALAESAALRLAAATANDALLAARTREAALAVARSDARRRAAAVAAATAAAHHAAREGHAAARAAAAALEHAVAQTALLAEMRTVETRAAALVRGAKTAADASVVAAAAAERIRREALRVSLVREQREALAELRATHASESERDRERVAAATLKIERNWSERATRAALTHEASVEALHVGYDSRAAQLRSAHTNAVAALEQARSMDQWAAREQDEGRVAQLEAVRGEAHALAETHREAKDALREAQREARRLCRKVVASTIECDGLAAANALLVENHAAELDRLEEAVRAARGDESKRVLAAQAAELAGANAARDVHLAQLEIAHAGEMYAMKAGQIKAESAFAAELRRAREEQRAELRTLFAEELTSVHRAHAAIMDEMRVAFSERAAEAEAEARVREGGVRKAHRGECDQLRRERAQAESARDEAMHALRRVLAPAREDAAEAQLAASMREEELLATIDQLVARADLVEARAAEINASSMRAAAEASSESGGSRSALRKALGATSVCEGTLLVVAAGALNPRYFQLCGRALLCFSQPPQHGEPHAAELTLEASYIIGDAATPLPETATPPFGLTLPLLNRRVPLVLFASDAVAKEEWRAAIASCFVFPPAPVVTSVVVPVVVADDDGDEEAEALFAAVDALSMQDADDALRE